MAHETNIQIYGINGLLSVTTISHYDYLIIGAGLVGSIAALALAQKFPERRIALLDEKPRSNSSLPFTPNKLDTRTIALNDASVTYFKQLDLWTDLEIHACPIKQVHVSEQGKFGSCLLRAQSIDYDALGFVIEIHVLYPALLKHLAAHPNIQPLHSVKVTHLTKQADHWQLDIEQLAASKHLSADTVILADGGESRLREQLNIACARFDYEQIAIVSVIQAEQDHKNTAYERFAADEILAILPLTHQRVGSVLTVPKSMKQTYLEMTDDAYLQKLQTLFGFRLGKLQAVGPRQSYPLTQCIAKQFVADHLILLGNTAHTVNPIGAQGLNLGIAGIKDLVGCLASNEPLSQFEMRQQARCEQIKSFTQFTAHIFSNPTLFTKLGRQAALFAIQHYAPLKNRLMRRMMGVGL